MSVAGMKIRQLNGSASTADDLVFPVNLEIRLMRVLLTGGTRPCFNDELPGTCVSMGIPSLSEG